MWRLADFLDPRRQSIQHHKRLGIDRLRMLPRQPPDRLGGPAEAARRPAAPVARALAPLQYPLDARAALDYPPLLVQPHHHAIVGVAALAVLPVQLVPHGPSPRSWEAARRARRALPVHLPGWGAICLCLQPLRAHRAGCSGPQPGPQRETARDGSSASAARPVPARPAPAWSRWRASQRLRAAADR